MSYPLPLVQLRTQFPTVRLGNPSNTKTTKKEKKSRKKTALKEKRKGEKTTPKTPKKTSTNPAGNRRTVGQNSQESGRKYRATRLSLRWFARTAHLFGGSALLASLARSATLTRSLAHSTHSLAYGTVNE